MKFLSISLGHNSTIAYYEDGKIVYLLHEEKFNNIKNSSNFPHLALKYLREKKDLSKLDGVYFTSLTIPPSILSYTVDKEKKERTTIFRISLYDRFMYLLTKYGEPLMNLANDLKIRYYQKKYRPKLEEMTRESIGYDIPSEKIHFVEHHVGHALSPVIFYGLVKSPDPYLIFTLDGSGDKYCATVRLWKDGKLETL
jgi:predicted NodU family carbamoyl transferase